MNLKILDIETTIDQFIKDWELNEDDVKSSLENDEYFEDDEQWVEITKSDDDSWVLDIRDGHYEVLEKINSIYSQKYFLFVKDVVLGQNEDGEDVEFTTWEIVGPDFDHDHILKGGGNSSKSICSSEEIEKFNELMDEGLIDYIPKYQERHFIKSDDFNEKTWYKSLKNLDLNDWDTYPSDFKS